MRSTPSFAVFPGPLWPGEIAPDKGPIYGSNRSKLRTFCSTELLEIELFFYIETVLTLN